MALFSIFMALMAVCAYCFFLSKFTSIKKGVLPFVVISASVLFFCLAGYLNLIFIAGVLWYAIAIVCLFFVFKGTNKTEIKPQLASFFTPEIIIFLSISAIVTIVLAINSPIFTRWDEFSFWGTAAKLVKQNNALYTFEAGAFTGKLGYPAALPVLSYIFQFLSTQFSEWAAMAAYNILAFSAFTAVISGLDKKYFKTAIIAFSILFFVPFIFEFSSLAQTYFSAYQTVYSEVPTAVLFGGVLSVYFTANKKSTPNFVVIAICLMTLALVKDVGFVLSFIAVFCIGADLLLVHRNDIKIFKLTKVWAVIVVCIMLALVSAISFFGWGMHVSAASGVDRNNVGAGDTTLSMTQVLISGTTELLGIGTTERFSQTLNNMLTAYFKMPVSFMGTGVMITAVIVLILAVSAVCLRKNKQLKNTAITFIFTGFIGLAGMMVFQLFAYVYVFDSVAGLGLADYSRYISVYYMGWFISALSMLCAAINNQAGKAPRVVMLAGFLATTILCIFFIKPTAMFFYKNENTDNLRQVISDRTSQISQAGLTKNDKVYFISQYDNSQMWYQSAFQVLPVQLEKPINGTLVTPQTVMDQLYYPVEISVQDFCDYLIEKECEYIFLDRIDEYVQEDMLPLFEDNLTQFYTNKVRLYKINTQNGKVSFLPYTGEIS